MDDVIVAAWSPDGTRLAGYRTLPGRRGEWEKVVVDVESGRERRLPIAAGEVVEDWSPDGSALAVMVANAGRVFEHPTKGTYPLRQVDLVRLDGSGREPLAQGELTDNLDARFAPDGTSLAFFRRRYPEGQVMYFAAVQAQDAAGARDLGQFDAINAGDRHFKSNGPPCWAPDGSAVAWFVPERKLQSSMIETEILSCRRGRGGTGGSTSPCSASPGCRRSTGGRARWMLPSSGRAH